MKTTNLIILIALISFSTMLQAKESAVTQLQTLTLELQKTPTDNALREKIIKLVGKTKPDIPEDAQKHFVEGMTISQMAKTPEQQKMAAQSFTEALKFAPWWSDAYYNLGASQELSEQYDEAEKTFGLYLLFNISKKENRDVQNRIYALAAKKKMAKSAEPDFTGVWECSGCDFPISFERNSSGWIVKELNQIKPIVRVEGRQIKTEIGNSWFTAHWDFTLSADGLSLEKTWYDTQSSEEYSRMKAASPSSMLTEINVRKTKTMKKKP